MHRAGVKKETGLHYCRCVFCGDHWFPDASFCTRCRQRLGLQAPYGEWPEWAQWLARFSRRRIYHEQEMLDHTILMDDMSWIADNAPPAEEMDCKELERIGEWLLSACTERQREAIRLRIYQDSTWVDAGQDMGISHAAVQKLVGRGIDKMKELCHESG